MLDRMLSTTLNLTVTALIALATVGTLIVSASCPALSLVKSTWMLIEISGVCIPPSQCPERSALVCARDGAAEERSAIATRIESLI